MGRSAGRKGRPGEFPRGLDGALPKAYVTLGVLPSAPRTVIEAAYRALAKGAHPDVGGSEARMQALNAAMATIRKERGWKR
jgi:curved DNA-binding protein CbpA